MKTKRLLIAIVAAACALAATAYTPPPLKDLPVHRYKVVTGDGGESILRGTSIRAGSGLCPEIILNGRVDTIVCAPRYITELPDEPDSPPPAPEAPTFPDNEESTVS